MEGPFTPAAGHKPVIQTSHWEGQTAKGCSGEEGSGATGSSGYTSHPPATSTSLGLISNPAPAGGEPSGARVTFDSSANKPARTGSEDIDVHRRQVTWG